MSLFSPCATMYVCMCHCRLSTLKGGAGSVRHLSLSQDGRFLASAGLDRLGCRPFHRWG